MNRRVGWVLAGVIAGILAVGPWESRSEAGTGPAVIRITDRQQAMTVVDVGPRGKSPGDMEVASSRVFQRGTGTTIGRSELVCKFIDRVRSRSCRGTYTLPKGKLVVGGTLLYRQFYDLAGRRRHRALRQRARDADRDPDAPQPAPAPRRLQARRVRGSSAATLPL